MILTIPKFSQFSSVNMSYISRLLSGVISPELIVRSDDAFLAFNHLADLRDEEYWQEVILLQLFLQQNEQCIPLFSFFLTNAAEHFSDLIICLVADLEIPVNKHSLSAPPQKNKTAERSLFGSLAALPSRGP